MSADYRFYRGRFGGTKISEADYGRFSMGAWAMLRSWIAHNAPETDNMRMCLCELAEYLYECGQRRGIAREENDGYSISYLAENESGGYAIARKWLLADGALFRGDCFE